MSTTDLLKVLEGYKNKISIEHYKRIETAILEGQYQGRASVHMECMKYEDSQQLENSINYVAEEIEEIEENTTKFIPSFTMKNTENIEGIKEDKTKAPQEYQQPKEHINENNSIQANKYCCTTDINNNINQEEIKAYKEKLIQEQQQQEQQHQEAINQLTPQKGQVKNENYDLPINTHPDNMTSKNVNYDLVGALTLNSYFGGNLVNHNGERFFYDNNLQLEKIGELLGKTERATKRFFDKLIKSDTNIIDVENTKKGIVYTINCKTDGKFYTTINHKQLYQILVNLKPDLLKLYLVIKFKCHDTNEPVKMTREYLGSKIGISTTSRNNLTKISSHTNLLETLGFIKKYNKAENIWDEKTQKKITKTYTYYSVCTYEQWAFRNPREAKLKYNKETGEYYFPEETE